MRDSSKPLVTYVVPTYNHSRFIIEAIESIIAQTYENIELIVINDGSTDDTVETISNITKKCSERFVRFNFISRHNKGLVPSLNEGLKWSNGEFFSMLASDDKLLPNKTKIMVDLILNSGPEVVAGFAGMKIIDADSNYVGTHNTRAGTYGFDDLIMKKAPYSAPTQIIRISELRLIGGYDENLLFEDWAILLALTKNGKKIHVIDEVVSLYRRHSSNISKQIINNHSYRMQVLNKYKDHKLYPRASARVLAGHASEIADTNYKDALVSLGLALKKYKPIMSDKKFIRGTADMLKSFIKTKFAKIDK